MKPAAGTLAPVVPAVDGGALDMHSGAVPDNPGADVRLPTGWVPTGDLPPADPSGEPTLRVLPVTGSDGAPAWLCLLDGDSGGRLRRRLAAELPALDAMLREVVADPSGAAFLPWLEHGTGKTSAYLVCARPGRTFAEDLGRGPLPVSTVLPAVLTCIEAVEVLHRLGRPHGQLSPATIHHDGTRVRLTAPLPPALAELVALDGGSGHEAPEVLRGGDSSAAGDAFSIASTAWTLLSGRPPYGGREDKLARLTAAVPPRLGRADIAPEVESALSAALAAEPGRRPDLSALAQALRIAGRGATFGAGGTASTSNGRDPAGEDRLGRQDTLAPTRPIEETGQPLGSRYLLDALIGRGTTGHVWRAHVRGTSARIAVKLMRPELAEDPEAVTRFMRERSTLMRLQHPNLVAVQDLVAEGGALAIVMDLVDGQDLRSMLAGGPLAVGEAARILAQTASALSAVHAAGILHRDLKPENVLVDRTDGAVRARLTDFGLARAVESSVLTRGSQLVGTPAYVAPEVVAGRPAGPPADVYALGVTAYETIAGRRPFVAESTAALLRAHLDEPPERPAGVDDEVWALVSACLAKDPAQRPHTAALTVAWWRLATGEAPAQLPEHRPALTESPAAVRPTDNSTGTTSPLMSSTGIEPTSAAQRPIAAPPTITDAPRPGRRRRWAIIGALVVVIGFGAGFGLAALKGTPTRARPPQVAVGYPLRAHVVISHGQPLVRWTAPPGLVTSNSVVVVSHARRGGAPGSILPPTVSGAQTSLVESDLKPGDCVVVYMYRTSKPPPAGATATPACVPVTSSPGTGATAATRSSTA